MKNKKDCILIFTILLIISSCHNKKYNNQSDEDCGKQISKSLSHINNFYFKKNPIYLDSALHILKGIENKSLKYKNIIFGDEVHVYFLKKDYSNALSTLNNIPDSIFPFPSFKRVYELKIRAKEAETNDNKKKQNECFISIISIYQNYLDDNRQAVEITLKQKDLKKIESTQIDAILSEMFFYKSKIQTMNTVISEIDSFQKKNNGNLLYFDELKKNIKMNDGKAMGILLY